MLPVAASMSWVYQTILALRARQAASPIPNSKFTITIPNSSPASAQGARSAHQVPNRAEIRHKEAFIETGGITIGHAGKEITHQTSTLVGILSGFNLLSLVIRKQLKVLSRDFLTLNVASLEVPPKDARGCSCPCAQVASARERGTPPRKRAA